MLQCAKQSGGVAELLETTTESERAAMYAKPFDPPSEVISFHSDNGQVRANYPLAFTLTSPPMVTAFPKLTREELNKDAERGINRLDYELDLTMSGAGMAQRAFREWVDGADDLLLDYVFNNQQLVGKKGMTKDQIAVMQKRVFKQRINYKTSKQYPDAMICRTKGLREYPRMPVYDPHSELYPLDVIGGDIVSVVLQYNGAYAKPNTFFGNTWQLIGVQRLGHQDKSDTVDAKSCFQSWDTTNFPAGST